MLATGCGPEPDHAIRATAGHELTIAAERHRVDDANVSPQHRMQFKALRVPEPDGPVQSTAGDEPPVCRHRHAQDPAVPFERSHQLLGVRIPESDCPVYPAARDAPPVL